MSESPVSKIPASVADNAATVPSRVLLAARDPAHDVVIDADSLVFCTDGTATYILDDRTGERREGSAADLRRVMRLFDALPEIDFVWPTLSARDLDPLTANIEIETISLESCTKHVQDEVRGPEYVAPLVDILEAVAGASLWERPIFSTIDCTVAPLQHERAMTEATIDLARAGVPINILPMPLMGTTAPMSVLGTCIVNMAELLSAVVLFQLAAPGCSLISGVGAAVAEMRSGLYLAGTPEVALIDLICIEMSRFYGIRSMGSAITADAKANDLQAGAEGMLTGLACALAGAESILAFGLLDGAQIVSLAKTVLDCDTVGAIRRFVRDDPVDEAAALLDDIREVGVGGHYLGRRSTRAGLRAGALWRPELFQRGPFESYGGRTLVDDAIARVDELLVVHEVPPLDDDVRRHIDQVTGSFRRTMARV